MLYQSVLNPQYAGAQADNLRMVITVITRPMCTAGGLFDPLGLSKGTEEQLRKYQENEVCPKLPPTHYRARSQY